MSRNHSDKNNIRSDIYENLPCRPMYNEQVKKLKANNDNELLNNCNLSLTEQQNNISLSATNNKKAANLSKELLYATPLRKSDRYKYNNSNRLVKITNNDSMATTTSINSDEKLSNLDYKIINNKEINQLQNNESNNIRNSNNNGNAAAASVNPVVNKTSNTDKIQPINNLLLGNNSNQNDSIKSCLEDGRILNFLKDTTQCQKKMDLQSLNNTSGNANNNGNSSKDCPNSSFSCLAREEHFANLVHKNFQNDSTDQEKLNNSDLLKSKEKGDNINNDISSENLELLMSKKQSPDKEINGFIVPINPIRSSSSSISRFHILINREWVLKKIALCLEQRNSSKKLNSFSGKNELKETASASSFLPRPQPSSNSTYHGCLVLGSNGSGKTSICQAIMNGNSGTKGILNRKLLACYFVNSQNPDCHSLSLFIRSIILQILSHSSIISKETHKSEGNENDSEKNNCKNGTEQSLAMEEKFPNSIDVAEELLIAELKLSAEIEAAQKKSQIDIQNKDAETSNKVNQEIIKEPKNDLAEKAKDLENKDSKKKSITRQKSAPENKIENNSDVEINSYSTHPPKSNRSEKQQSKRIITDNAREHDKTKTDDSRNGTPKSCSPVKKSKIPISKRSVGNSIPVTNSKNTGIIQQGGGEDIADVMGDDLKNEIEAAINDDNTGAEELPSKENIEIELKEKTSADLRNDKEEVTDKTEKPEIEDKSKIEMNNFGNVQAVEQSHNSNNIPPILPKPKSCRTIIADSYYEMILSNPEIFECLNVDNIEKNPDECFKKALLFPLLELTPPRSTLLLLVDSIDENYINEGNLISTLKGRTLQQKSRNIAELLSNHIHLFPKWLFLVFTAKKQTKNVTKMFSGFKKITLDDLRKSHVVKDVQEYIINRLNSDFKGTVNLTKEIIESLHQLYIKSNGCILYLEKVLNGIKENFFSFREIKLIPCTLNGLYLYICQKSFNKKQYYKIRPILNILLASIGYVDRQFLYDCLRTHNYQITLDEFQKRLDLMRNILIYDYSGRHDIKIKLFHNSFADWLVDVKFATKKFICDVNEGHVMISMYYLLISEELCANTVRKFIYHLIQTGEYLTNKNINLDLILILLESKINLNDCFYTNHLNCCSICENEYRTDINFLPKTKEMIRKFLTNELNEEFGSLLCDFFKPNLPTDTKILKLLIETGINNADSQASCDSSLMSPELSEKSANIDFELADLLLTSEKTCLEEINRPKSSSDKSTTDQRNQAESQDDNTSTLHQLSDSHRIEMHKGKALIHILANDGSHHLLERALNACKGPIDLEIEDYNGQTALNIASRNGHLEVVKLLLSFSQPMNDGTGRMKRVDVNHADRDGWSPLRSASWGGHTEVVKALISHPGCKIDLADKEGRTALRAAAWSGHEDILKILIESGADVNSVDRQGRTSLIAASYMGHYDIVEILLDNGANVNHLDLDGRSALCVAALCGSSGYSKVISTLLEHGAHTDQLDNDGMSPLLVSSFEGNSEVCELLLENGADPDLADFMGRTPLWAACTAGHANVVKLLLFWGCGIDCMDSEGRTVLSIAAAQGNVETVRQLLDRGLDETHRDNAGWTPLHYASFEGFHEVCLQLLESGAKIDECDNEGKTALHLAAQEGRQKCLQTLLEIHNSFIDQKAHDGKTAFRLACLEDHLDCVQILLKFGCDINSKDADSRTTMYILALENKLDVAKFLLSVTDIDANIPDSEGRTALHVTAWQGHVEMVKLLITLGNANVNAMDLELRPPLHSCAWQGNHEVMEILLYFGAIPDHACKQGATALGISAQEGHDKCVAILLKYGANPYKSDHCGRTPIKLAAKSNRNNILKIFESYVKTDESNVDHQKNNPNLLRSPDVPPSQIFLTQQQNNLMPNNNNNNNNMPAQSSTNTTNSNFYENTMRSDNSSLQKRKSVISSQSGSSNDVPLSFTQQLQRQTKLNSRNNPFIQNAPINNKYQKVQRHSQVLPDLNEHQLNIISNVQSNDADMFDIECMSPLYATPPHSPCSDLSSPGQLPTNHPFIEIGGSNINNDSQQQKATDNHFARDTHMRIILGNCKDNSQSSKSKRSGITTNPAMRLIRSRFDSAANLIRRTNNMLSSGSQGSSSIGVKSGTFQWRKESQM